MSHEKRVFLFCGYGCDLPTWYQHYLFDAMMECLEVQPSMIIFAGGETNKKSHPGKTEAMVMYEFLKKEYDMLWEKRPLTATLNHLEQPIMFREVASDLALLLRSLEEYGPDTVIYFYCLPAHRRKYQMHLQKHGFRCHYSGLSMIEAIIHKWGSPIKQWFIQKVAGVLERLAYRFPLLYKKQKQYRRDKINNS